MTGCPQCQHEIVERFCPWCGHDSRMVATRLAPYTRVYVVQNQTKNGVPKFDISPAQQFGKIEYLLPPDARATTPELCISVLHNKLRHIRATDYLLLLGNPCLIGWTVAIASHYSGGALNLLQWEKRADGYVVIPCDVMKTN